MDKRLQQVILSVFENSSEVCSLYNECDGKCDGCYFNEGFDLKVELNKEKLNPDDMKEYYKRIIIEMKAQLEGMCYIADLSDLGNEIGIVIGKHIDSDFEGWGKDDFLHGIEHGIALKKK